MAQTNKAHPLTPMSIKETTDDKKKTEKDLC